MRHVAHTTANTISLCLPLVFLGAVGVFIVSIYDLIVMSFISGTSFARAFSVSTTGLADNPWIPLLISGGTMFILAVLTDEK